MIPPQTVVDLTAAITGNVASQQMVRVYDGAAFGEAGIEAGGRIVLGSGTTTVKVKIVDNTGKVLYSDANAVTANTDIAPIPTGIRGPLYVTTTNINDVTKTVTIYWFIKR